MGTVHYTAAGSPWCTRAHLHAPGPPAGACSAYTENGNLVLRTRRQDRWCGNRFFRYTSGWVDTLDKLTIRNGSACRAAWRKRGVGSGCACQSVTRVPLPRS